MFVDQLAAAAAAKLDREIVERADDSLQLDPLDEEDRNRDPGPA
jgi:hypothetical protein